MSIGLRPEWVVAAILATTGGAMTGMAQADGSKGKESAVAVRAPKSAGIRFSNSRGFQREPFMLALSPGEVKGTIRYTLDGSAPGRETGRVYEKPIAIGRTSIVRAAMVMPDGTMSRVQTHTYLFPADVMRQSPDGLPPEGWPYAWGGNAVDYGMDPDVVGDPKYAAEMEPALLSLPSFSVVMDLKDLFDDRRGIYANSDREGREWERPASLELLTPVGRKGFQEDCGVRIRGGFSSGGFNPKHAFRVFFRKEYGDGKLKYPVFGEGGAREFDSFDLRCSQNYSWNIGGDARGLFLRDQFSRDLQLAMGQPAARGNFCHLYVNGQYWGLYDTCERPEASFGEAYLGGKKSDYDVIKTGGIGGGGGGMAVAATDGSMDAWNKLHALATEDLADNAKYFRLLGCKPDGTPDPTGEVFLDPMNLIDYLLVIWYGGNIDSPVTKFGGDRMPNNWHGMRNRATRDGFKFFVWDAEHTLLDVEEDRTGPFPSGDQPGSSSPQWLYQRCLANAEFRVLLADRIQHHLGEGGILSATAIRERFTRRVREIERAVVAESARWGDCGGMFPFGGPGMQRPMKIGPDGQPKPMARTRDQEWRTEIDRILNDFIPKRSDIVLFQLWRQGLTSDVPLPIYTIATGAATASFKAERGEVWYTTDGSDPRKVGGAPSASARKVEGELAEIGRAVLTARTRLNDDWSPLVRVPVAAQRR